MLKELVRRWLNHKVMVRWLSRFFHYLDRYFIARRSLPALKEVGLTCFRDLVYQEVNVKVRDAVICLIDQEREGEQIDRALLKNVLDIFVEIGMGQMDQYENDFEATMLKDTAAYYLRKASNWILEDSCPDYMLKAEECLKLEKERVAHYLHSSSETKLLETVQNELLSVYATQLLEKEHSGCHALLRDDKVDDLSRMYRLFSKIPRGLEPVANIFKQHVTAEGTALVKQAEDAASNKKAEKRDIVGLQEQVFVRKVVELHDKFMAYVNDCFLNHTLFHKALKEAFEIFCNKGVAGSSSAELLARFCDNILKKGGSEKLSDEAIEETLEKVVKLLAYISDKDLFAEFYRKKLARRLLFDKRANDEHERSILTKLKQQCGGQFTSKMEGMVTDLTLARENQASFEEYLSVNQNANPGIDLTVTVLTTGFWPSYKSFDLNLPAEMSSFTAWSIFSTFREVSLKPLLAAFSKHQHSQNVPATVKCVEVFREFYQTKTKHGKLTWIYTSGTCNINGKFEPNTIELIVTTYQAAALLLFNASERLSYQEIMAQLNLSDEDVVRLLHSLSCAKYKILIKEPSTKTISPNDVFEFNSKFTDKMRRIKIPLPPVDEKKKVIEDVDKDRRYAIDASIVRIMKSRKVLNYQNLVMECVEQLGRMFKVNVMDTLSRLSHDADTIVSLAAIVSLGLVGAGTNNARIAEMLRNLSSYYYKDASLLFCVRIAQGLVHMGSQTGKTALAGLVTMLHACLDMKAIILGKFNYVLYFLVLALQPRMLMTMDEDLIPPSVLVRVGQAVGVVGQAGRPKTITGFQTHSTLVLLSAGYRAELATEKYIPLSPILEGFVIVKFNPEYHEDQ